MSVKGKCRKIAMIMLIAAMLVGSWAPAAYVSGEDGPIEIQPGATDLYFVDCGDPNVNTVSPGDDLGEYNSVTDQLYAVDPKAGKAWGIVDAPLGGGDIQGGEGSQSDSGNGEATAFGGVSTNWTWPHENGGVADGANKEVSNRYTKNQYEKAAPFGANTRKITYRFEVEPGYAGEYYVETYCRNPWNCSASPMIYANQGTSSEVIIANPLSVPNGSGAKASAGVTAENGFITLDYVGTGSANLAVNVSYIIIRKTDDATKLREAYNSLSIAKSVSENLFLPSEGSNGASIAWSSSDPGIVSDNGVIARAEYDQNAVLTATLTLGDYKISKQFTVTVRGTEAAPGTGIGTFAIEDVEITDSYYVNAANKDVDNLLSLDVDRFLAGFRETAAYAANMGAAERTEFMRNATRYGGWENSRIGGHTVGHYMTAIAQAYKSPNISAEKKNSLKSKMDALIAGLLECQQQAEQSEICKPGYIFGATLQSPTSNLERQFDSVEGKGGDNWVPWYTMHKIITGLLDVYKLGDNEDALAIALGLGEWVYDRTQAWSGSMQTTVLNIEYGGMNDCLYELYAIMKDKGGYTAEQLEHIVAAAHKFDETSLFETVKGGGANVLNNRHANTTIPKFMGALNRYVALGKSEDEAVYLEYAEKFWQMVIDRHTYITGGNSENEHFGADNVLYREESNTNNETCNTYNMLKMSRLLYECTGDKKYLDYYENTYINAIMSSQNPESGMTMYFQPMATGYHKVFGTSTGDFWCCTGTGMENFTKLNDSIYYKKKTGATNTVIVSQYLSSILTWTQQNMKLTQVSGIQTAASDTATFTVEKLDSESPMKVNLELRLPDWAADRISVKVNDGEPALFDAEDGMAVVPNITNNATITVTIPMEAKAYSLPDSPNTYALKYGPLVLSAKLGNAAQATRSHGVNVTISSQKAVASDSITIFAEGSVSDYMDNIAENLQRVSPGRLSFVLNDTNCAYEFVPHYSQYEESYGIYWTYSTAEGGRSGDIIKNEKNVARKDRVILDSIQAGYGQYEYGLEDGDGTSVGSSLEHTRYANAGGYFQYEVIVDESGDNYLVCTLRREDNGLPFKISVGGTALFDTDALDDAAGYAKQIYLSDAEFRYYYNIMVKIPKAVVESNIKTVARSEGGGTVDYRVVDVKFEGSAAQKSAALYNWMYNQKPFATENALSALKLEGEDALAVRGVYEITVPYTKSSVQAEFVLDDSKGYVSVNGLVIDDTAVQTLALTSYLSEYVVKVYAEDFETYEEYLIKVSQDQSGWDVAPSIADYFTFDETLASGKGQSSVASTVRRATVPSSYTATPTYGDGVFGKAISLPGSSYGLKLGNAAILGESYTISYWMKPSSVKTSVDPTFAAGVFSPEHWLSATFDGKLWSRSVPNNTGYVATSASNAYKAGEWQHVAIVVNGEKPGTAANTVAGTLYLNGQAVSEGDVVSGIMTVANAITYFGVNAWDAYYGGMLDDLVMIKGALSPAQAASIRDQVVDLSGTRGDADTEAANAVIGLIGDIGQVVRPDTALKARIDSARAAYDGLTFSQKMLVTNYNALREAEWAYDLLGEATADKDMLEIFIGIAEEELASDHNYIPASVANLEAALEEAKSVYSDIRATQEEVDEALDGLLNAIWQLYDKGDKTDLQTLIDMMEQLSEDDYTPNSWADFQDMLDAAKAVAGNENAIQDRVDKAIADLQDAFGELVRIADFRSLASAVTLANRIIANLDDYIASTVLGLEEQVALAQAVLSDRNSTQAEVDAARNALNKLIAKARLKPDKSPILNALAEARSLNMSLYTAASAKSLNALLAKADALLAAPEEKVTQSEINALATEIKGAIKDLEPKQGASVPAANDDKAATLGGNASNVGKESTVSDKLDKAEAEKAKPATAASGIQVAPSTGATSQTQTSAGQTQVPADQPATATPNDAAVIAGIPAPAASDADIVASGDVAADGIGVVVGAEAVAESKESGMPAYWLAIALIILVVCGLFGYRFGILKRQAQGRGGSKK